MRLETGDFVTVDAPNGEWIEGRVICGVPDAYDEPFEVATAEHGAIMVQAPWDCEIEIEFPAKQEREMA